MTTTGIAALVLGLVCLGVLVHDLRARRTAFAQFAATRTGRPRTFWLGIACWGACLTGSLLVAFAEHERQLCEGQHPCVISVEVSA
jgi:hypothetical protein